MGMVKGKWEFTVSHFFVDFSGFAGIWANGLREVIVQLAEFSSWHSDATSFRSRQLHSVPFACATERLRLSVHGRILVLGK